MTVKTRGGECMAACHSELFVTLKAPKGLPVLVYSDRKNFTNTAVVAQNYIPVRCTLTNNQIDKFCVMV